MWKVWGPYLCFIRSRSKLGSFYDVWVCLLCNKMRLDSSKRIIITNVNLHMKLDCGRKCILINNTVREDGILINDKNKVDFTIGNNQINDSNINNVETSKSFFRMGLTYGPRSYDKPNKVLLLSRSQPDQHKEITSDDWSLTNARGRLQHIKDCNNINNHARKIKSLNQT